MLTRMNGLMRWSALITTALLMTACARTVVVQQPPQGEAVVQPVQAANRPGTYTVAKGDTLYSIAFRNGTDFRALARQNGIAEPYTIWPGQVLQLPGHGAAVPAPVHAPPPVVIAKAPVPVKPTAPPPGQGFQTVPAAAGTTPPAPMPTTVVPVAGVNPPPAAPTSAAAPAAPAATPVVATGGSRTAGGVKWRWPATGSVVGRFQASAAIPGIDIAGKAGDPVVAAADGVVVYSGNGLVGYGELVIIKHNDSFLSAYGHNRKRLVTEGQQVKAGQQIAEMGSSGSTRDELQFQIRKDGTPVDPLGYLPSR
ncbi:peptidoglycan DD-metalloendopeptidase family protein [Dyella acidiphila]|uniref:Peptidoglycan DD-metalloendopeptidase family protein n=1 Tax=Dyella acidiphila TaxID=2775866 RepID=A0ABR9GA96_9GAMM|nr:peptidoglycan DD-metalloendopeptidase family protein [Dyella acidiphila]MBE1160983.1 peptidoglycan DD-metalloendopeptidase family protein [Dyella acidiphila]